MVESYRSNPIEQEQTEITEALKSSGRADRGADLPLFGL